MFSRALNLKSFSASGFDSSTDWSFKGLKATESGFFLRQRKDSINIKMDVKVEIMNISISVQNNCVL